MAESYPSCPVPSSPLPIVSPPVSTAPRLSAGLLVAGPLLLAATVRLIDLGNTDLWLDEAMSYHFASLDVSGLVAQLRLDSGPPLYYLLLRGWCGLFGSSEPALRALSALFGVLSVFLAYGLGRHAFGLAVGRRAALLLAVLPLPVFYAHQARAYTLLAAAAIATVWALSRWFEHGHQRNLWFVSACLTIALYSHNYALFLVPALAAPILLARQPERRPWPALFALGVALAAYAPWGLTVLQAQLANRAPTAWMRLVWDAYGVSGSLLGSLRALAPGAPQAPYVGLQAVGWATPWTTVLMAVLLVLGLGKPLRSALRVPTSTDQRWSPTLVISYAFLPLAACLAVSLAGAPVYLPGRLDQLVAPAMVLLLALGIEALPRPTLRGTATGLVVTLSLATLAPAFMATSTDAEPPGDRAMAAAIEAMIVPGDAIVTTGLTRAPLAYNLRARAEPTFYSFPAEVADHLGNLDAETMLADRPAMMAEAKGLLDHVARQPDWSGRVILVLVPDALGALLLEALNARPRQLGVQVLGDFQQSRLGTQVRVFVLDVDSASRITANVVRSSFSTASNVRLSTKARE